MVAVREIIESGTWYISRIDLAIGIQVSYGKPFIETAMKKLIITTHLYSYSL